VSQIAERVKNRLSRLDGYPPRNDTTALFIPERQNTSEEKGYMKNHRPYDFAPFADSVTASRTTLTLSDTPFLRHSWNRVDSIAVVAFWISFALAMTGVEPHKSVYLFRGLSVLRSARLLTVTKGTSVGVSENHRVVHEDSLG
jgi:hypothetical protein